MTTSIGIYLKHLTDKAYSTYSAMKETKCCVVISSAAHKILKQIEFFLRCSEIQQRS